MHIGRIKRNLIAPLSAGAFAIATAPAAAFELALPEHAIVITVPAVPGIAVQPLPATAAKPAAALRLAGTDGAYRFDVALFDQGKPVSARECAGVRLRAIVSQPGMPDRDHVYRAPLSASTFLVVYAIGRGVQRDWHAHLIAAAGTAHCADAHFTRPARAGEDGDEWRLTFTNARIDAAAR